MHLIIYIIIVLHRTIWQDLKEGKKQKKKTHNTHGTVKRKAML